MKIAIRLYLAAIIVLGVLQIKRASADLELIALTAQNQVAATTACR
jgi:hypothetical protein